MTRITALLGSPRANGNSDLLARRFCDIARAHGADTRCRALRELRFDGFDPSTAGLGLHGPDDDLAPVLAEVEEADVVVLATPVYFCNMTGLLKQAFDRFFCFLKPDYVTNPEPSRLRGGKTLVFIQAQGEGAEHYGGLLDQYGPSLDKLGFARRELVRACNVRDPGDVLARTDVLERVAQLAKELAAGST